MSRYAHDTAVTSDKSESEIKQTLRRYGADQYVSGWRDGQVLLGFVMNGKALRFVVPMPPAHDFVEYVHGNHTRVRSPQSAAAAQEQACRQRWRALALVVKAKLEAVESGITTFESEFMAHIVIPGTGKTAAELLLHRIDEAYKTGKAPQLGWEG